MTRTVTVTATVTQDGTRCTAGARFCVEIDQLADTAEIVAAQDLADRVSAMFTKRIRSV